jgi:type I restriction enzyme S subunit
VFGSNGLVGKHSVSFVKEPAIIIGRKGTVGAVTYSKVPCWPIDTTFFVTGSQQADIRFLYYLLQTLGLEHMNSDSAVPGLNRDAVHGKKVLIPQLEEQKEIVSILAPLDDKIDLNRQINETLENIAKAVFKSWFIDFDPVRAKSNGKQPVGMSAEIASLFPDSFHTDSEHELPKGWKLVSIGSISNINSQTLKSSEPMEELKYIDISSVDRGDVKEVVVYQRGTEPSRARRKVKHGDTVISTVRPERRAYFLAFEPDENLIVSTGFAVISPHTTPWSLVHACLTQPDVFALLGNLADGGAYPAINPEVIAKLKLAMPDKPGIIDNFSKSVIPLYSLTAQNRRQSRTLAELRDLLLPKLLSGELKLKEAEKQLEQVL